MCLGLPGKIIERGDDRGTLMGTVDFGGATRRVCLAYTPEADIGDYVIVHAGFAISVLDEKAAAESLKLFEELAFLDPAGDPGSPAVSR